jgi:hypothetical protein
MLEYLFKNPFLLKHKTSFFTGTRDVVCAITAFENGFTEEHIVYVRCV